MKNTIFAIVLFAVTCYGSLQVKSEEHPAIADQSDNILHVVTATGHKVRVMQTNLKIGLRNLAGYR